jgi:radical SAM superfamily enzyme YgiQ (UPF0313 family)
LKILFIYPNHQSELRVPLAISILIAKLRSAGHTVKLFDSTFYGKFKTDDEIRLDVEKTNLTDLVGKVDNVEPRSALNNVISSFHPEFIFTSLVERNFQTAKELLRDVSIPILVGGILPTIAPDFVSSQDWIDYICVGEGEDTVLDFLKDPKDIYPIKLPNLDETPFQDWSDFDQRHLLKPFMGKVYRGGAFEFSRGCGKSCSFCVAPQIRKTMVGCGKYHRTKSPERVIEEITIKQEGYGLDMISFGDTDFLQGVPKDVIKRFLRMYSDCIKLPFTIQTSVETLTDPEILDWLHTAQCCAISVGVESGSDRIRKSIIHKSLPKELFKKAFKLCREHNLRLTANYMVGLPTETEEDVYETIKFNKELNPPSIAVTYFTPFMGTELYEKCIKDGLYEPFQENVENVYELPPLKMPQFSQEQIIESVKRFTDDFKTYQKDFSIL